MSYGGHAPGGGRCGATEFPHAWSRDRIRIGVVVEMDGEIVTAVAISGLDVIRDPSVTGWVRWT